MDAILSVFRRGYQHWHICQMEGDVSEWNFDWDLEGFLSYGKDLFHLEEHLANWRGAKRSYPILLVKYEALWDYLPEVFAFLELDPLLADEFPKRRPRRSDWRDEPRSVRDALIFLYGDLSGSIERMPEIEVLSNRA